MYGWQGTILRINLTTGDIRKDPLPMDLVEKYLGGGGLNARMLFDEVTPDVDPLSPDNPIIIGAGPLVGSIAPNSGRWTITAKSVLTKAYGDTNSGGHFGAEMKFAGYDHIIIKGKAKDPVYIWIDDAAVEIRDAKHLWGKTVWETDDALKEELGDEQVRTACIGPGAEDGMPFGAIVSMRYRAGGRGGGMGTVMASKNLKAVVVRGSGKVKIANPEKAAEACKEMMDSWYANPMHNWLEDVGILLLVEIYSGLGILPLRGGKTGFIEPERAAAFAHNLHTKHLVTKKACYGCPIACTVFRNVKEGPYAGCKGEKPELPGAINYSAFHDMPTIEYGVYLTDECQKYGIDQIEVGALIGMAFDWYERGLITKKDTDGLELVWGNEEAGVKLFHKIVKREGIGAILALGVQNAIDKMGPEYEPPQGAVKGVAEVMPDLRAAKSFALGAAISPRGSDHLKSFPTLERQPAEVTKRIVGSEIASNPLTEEDKYLNCAWSEDLKTLLDELGICIFPFMMIFEGYPIETIAKLFCAITGVERTWEELKLCGERGWVAMRCFNAWHGMARKDDTLPKGLTDVPKPDGVGAGQTIDLQRMLDDYYAFRGWDTNGVPTRKRLEELGMKDIADRLGLKSDKESEVA